MIGAPQRESPPPPIARDRLSPTKVLPTTTSGYRFPPQASAGWVRLVSEPSLSQPSFGFYKPESQDLLLSPALVRGCTAAGTRPVASMVRPPERTDAARSHDFGSGVSPSPISQAITLINVVKRAPPDVRRGASHPAAGLGWATLGYPSAAMALGWARNWHHSPCHLVIMWIGAAHS